MFVHSCHRMNLLLFFFFFFCNDTATTEIYTLSLHDALPIYASGEATASGYVASPGGSTVTVQVTVGSESATFTILVSVPAATIKVVSGNNQSAVINTPLSAPLVVQVQDKSGNPAPFSPVFFSASGLQTLSSTSVTADEK